MKSSANIKTRDNIIFGLIFFLLFLAIGLYPLKTDENIRVWSVVLCLVFLTVTIIKPNKLIFFHRLWIKFGILLGRIISPIVMGLVFFGVVTPIGIFIKILKKDVMSLKKSSSSYWINRQKEPQPMSKQF
jgi:hypothetical protein